MNPNSYLFDAHNRPVWSFGGAASFRTTSYRGYNVFFEWLIEPSETQPMLIIQPIRGSAEMGAFAICLGAVGMYLEPNGSLTPQAFALCKRALPTLGKADLDMEVHNLMAVVHRFLPDIINMTPVPQAARREEANAPVIEIELKDESSGKTLSEVSV